MGTKYNGNPTEIQSLNTFIKFIRASEKINSKLRVSLAKEGISESQFYTLDALFHLGSLPQKEIGKKISCSEGNITMVVDNLEKEGLVSRVRSELDRRVYFVQLTKKGEKKIKSLLPIIVEKIVGLFSVLNDKEQEELQSITKKVGLSPSVND